MNERSIVVISDVHIGAGPLDDFDTPLEAHLCDFLQKLSERVQPVEFVVNGDFLEFIQAPPWCGPELESRTPDNIPLCFTQDQSLKKLRAIHEAHSSVFEVLGRLLESPRDNRLVIVPGNHDADFFWPEVRECFTQMVCGSDARLRDRIDFHMEQVYRPEAFPGVWIEHGHQYDPLNAFKVDDGLVWSEAAPPIFVDKDGQERLYECVGTRLLIKYLNALDYDYPFIDNVKPFSRFIALFGLSIFAPSYFIKAASGMWGLLKFLSTISLRHRGDLMDAPEEIGIDPRPVLREWEQHLSAARREAFYKALDDRGFPLDRSLELYVSDIDNAKELMNFLSDNMDLIEDPPPEAESSLLGIDEGTMGLYRGFKVNETVELTKKAKEALKRDGVKAVIMGHTHEVVSDPALPYINAGCWTRYLDFRKTDRIRSWSVLREDSYELFPYQLNYVEIKGDDPTLVTKHTFTEN